MNKTRLSMLIGVLLLSLALVGMALAADNNQKPPPPAAGVSIGTAPIGEGGVNSLSGSYVAFDPSVGGDSCFIPGNIQTFCFRAESFTNDYEYVYNVWEKFPSDWTVTNVYVQGTPACTNGSWGAFGWSFQTAPYEVNISHARYQATADHCVAYYCFEVVAGTGVPDALESWFWDGDGYGSPPHWPCSNDQYTPAGQSACDEAVNPQAAIPVCALEPGVFLNPPELNASGCNGFPQVHTFSLFNNTGADGTFDMTYIAPVGMATLTGPDSIPVSNGATVPFDVILEPNVCNFDTIVAAIDAAGNGYADTSIITKTISDVPSWETVPASAPNWAGSGYPRDGCTARNAAGEWVTYLFGDTTSIFGFWGYNLSTNTWFQPGAENTPADRWAPDWAYDPDTNQCYVTGGANTPGGGTYTEAYQFDPVANAFMPLGNFTSARDFHNSWVGTIDGYKYLCIGGGVNSASILIQATQCYDLLAGLWVPENTTMAPFPTDPFGAADGTLHAVTGDQFWYVGGSINAFGTVTDEARYWDDADNSWHFAGNTGVPRYRVEGDFFNSDFYQLGGSSGGFSPTADAVRGRFDGTNWVWTALPNMNNIRMDNVVGVTDNNIWSFDGYGANASSYVEYLVFCPLCEQPDIEVTPLSLQAIQPPDTITTQTMQICNVGGAPLDWEITEVPPVLGESLPLAPITVEPSNRMPASMIVSSPSAQGITPTGSLPTAPVHPEAILWEQTTSYSQAGVSDDFPLEGWGAFSADDFQNSEPWSIETIFVPGWMVFGSIYDATALHWCIYPDAGGIPSGHPYMGGEYWCGSLSPSDPAVTIGGPMGGDVTLDLVAGMGAPLVVPPGTWWLTFFPEFSSSGVDFYYWAFGDTGNLSNAQLVDPMNYFDGGWTSWTPWTNLGVTYWDLSFRLEGEIVSFFDIPWLSESPITGTTPAGECTLVDVTFDSTGLMPGDYFGGLEIVSNDPEEPEVGVPVQLTVTPPPPIIWEKFINGQAWYPGITVTVVTSDVIMVEEVLHLMPQVGRSPQKTDQADTLQVQPRSPTIPIKTPETVSGVQPALQTLPAGPSKTLQASGLLYLTSLDLGNATFAVYDPETDSWTALAPYETGCQMAVSSTGQLFAYGFNTQMIDVYDPSTDTWIPISPAPPGSTGQYCNLEITITGEFLYTEWMGTTLWYTMGGVWNMMPLPFSTNAMGDYDPTTDQYVIGEASTTNAHWIDLNTWTITDYFSPVGNGEYARFSVVMGNRYYFEAGGSNIYSFDLSNPALPPMDHGVNWGWYSSAAGDRANMVIYNASIDGTGLALFDPLANTLSPLTGYNISLWHSSVAFVPSGGQQGPIFAQIENWDPTRLQLIDWAATGGQVIVQPGRVEWTGEIDGPITIMLTKWFHVEPGDWTDTLLWEELWLDQTELEQRPVNIIHNIDVPDISVNPNFLISTLLPNSQETQNLSVCNVGNAPLDWSLAEIPGLKVNSVNPGTVAKPPHPVSLSLDANGISGPTAPAPLAPNAGIALVLDDGSRDNDIGIGGTQEFLWVNRFTPAPDEYPFMLNEVWVYFSSAGNVNVGDNIKLVMYENTTGGFDPAPGSNYLGGYLTTVQALDAWNVYVLPDPVAYNGPGDAIIGVIGLEVPGTSYWPASMDQTVTQQRSWAGWWNVMPPPDPPLLPPDASWVLIDNYFPGNWMVRGYGETIVSDIPWLSENPTSGTVLPGECAVINVTFDSTGLDVLVYHGGLDITSNDPDTPVLNVPVTLSVNAPDITLNAPPLETTLHPGEVDALNMYIGNIGNWNLTWAVTDGATWLNENPESGTVSPNTETQVVVFFDSTGLTPGVYNTNVVITSNDPDQPLISLPAILTVIPRAGAWTQIPLPNGCPDYTRFDAEYFSGNGMVYILGGRGGSSGGDTFGNVWSFDPVTQTCADSGTVMPTPVSNYTIVTVNNGTADVLCIFGGRKSDGTYANLAQCYDPVANTATSASILPGELPNYIPGGAAVLNNIAYVFSGFRNTTTPYTIAETWAWEPVGNTWTQLGVMTLGRGYINVAVANGLIYGFGGDTFDGTNLVAQTIAEVFDPAAGTWSDAGVADLPTATGEGRAYGFDTDAPYELAGKIIVAGGGVWPADTAEAFSYDIASDTYDYTFADLNVSRRNSAGFFVPGDPTGAMWVFGGRSSVDTPPYAPPEYYTVAYVPPPPEPDIDVTPLSLETTLLPDQSAMLDLTIANVGTVDLVWSVSDGVSWLSESPDAGIIPASGSTPVVVTFDSAGLAPGVYETDLVITSNDPDEPTVTIPVTLTVVAPDILVTAPPLELTLMPNQMGMLNFTIANVGTYDLEWSLADDAAWLSEDPISGTIAPAGSTQVDVIFDSNGLAPGHYTGTITITSNDPDQPSITLDVSLTVLNYNIFIPITQKH